MISKAWSLHQDLWGAERYTTKNSTKNPISIGRDDLVHICDGKYLVSSKSNGIRCTVLIGVDEEGEQFAASFDRLGRGQFFGGLSTMPVAPECDKDMPNIDNQSAEPSWGTLFDCENVNGTFIILDVVTACGYDMKPNVFTERMRIGSSIIKYIHIKDKIGVPVVFRSKPFVKLHQIKDINYDKDADGLIFMPTGALDIIGKRANIYKWKTLHTIDVLHTNNGAFFAMRGSQLVPLVDIHCSVVVHSELQSNVVYEVAPLTVNLEKGGVCEFEMLCPRHDKVCANQVTTISASIRHHNDDLTWTELVAHFTR